MTLSTVTFSTDITTLVESENSVITFKFEVDGDIPEGGLSLNLDVDAVSPLWITDFSNFSRTGLNEAGEIDTLFILREATGFGGELVGNDGSTLLARDIPLPFDTIPLLIEENEATFQLTVFDDFFAEENEVVTFSVAEGDGYTVASDPVTVTFQDGPDGIINPSDVPVVGVSVTAADLIVEDDPSTREITLAFDVTGDIPDEGIPIFLESDGFDILGDFDSDSIVLDGVLDGRFNGVAPVEFGRGFVTTLIAPQATITLNIANDAVTEGIQTINFNIVDGEGYDVNPDSSSVSITIEDPPNPVPVFGDNGSGSIVGSDRNDDISGLGGNDTIFGGDGNDTIDGGQANDNLFGEAGIDSLSGGNGQDNLDGGDGNDDLSGGNGRDTLIGGNGDDILDGGDGSDLIIAGEGRSTISGGTGNDTIFSGENDSEVDGGTGNDIITTGFFSDDLVFGGAGNDTISTNGDDDTVLGGDGNDSISGGNEEDILFGGLGNDTINGDNESDVLSGGAGDDLIYGGAGNDTIMGVTGNDILVGDNFSDSGSDLFVFGNGDGTDTILDFEVGIDLIGLVEGELLLDDLTLTQDGANTLLGVADTGETLAILNGVQASALGVDSFTIVPDVSNLEEAEALL